MAGATLDETYFLVVVELFLSGIFGFVKIDIVLYKGFVICLDGWVSLLLGLWQVLNEGCGLEVSI